MRYIWFIILPLWVMANYKSYGISIDGQLKYQKGFTHFEYANPKAKKGGIFRKHAIGSFDSFHPFIMKGTPASHISLLYDTLMTASMDEKFSKYGLIAKSIEVDSDRKWVRFYLRKGAKFSDGKPITSADVKFSFDILMSKGAPFYRKYYADIKAAKIIDAHTIEFVLNDPKNKELPLIISELVILPKHYWQDKDFSKSTLTPPVGSGAYKIADFKPGKFIVYERDRSYWGKALNVNKGFYNADEIKITYFRDQNVALEAFKSGEYDFRSEYIAKVWTNMYKGKNFTNGWIKKEEILHANPQGMQSFVFNTRKAIFKDRAVREAISLLFDFEWANKNLFYNQYTRTDSFFENSDLASNGLPSEAELKLLTPLKAYIPKEVFTTPFKLPVNSGDGNIRSLMRKSLAVA